MKNNYDFFLNVFLFVWPKCRMKCKYCLESNTNNYRKFEKEDITKIIKILGNKNVKRVWLTGGEATLCPHILEYITLCKQYKIEPRFSTQDGISLKRLLPNLSDIKIQLSLNGIYSSHDEITQVKNSFFDIESAVDEIKSMPANKNISLSARFIVRPECINQIEDYIKWCINHGINEVFLSNISSGGKGKNYIESHGKLSQDKFAKMVDEITKRYKKEIVIHAKYSGEQGDLCGIYPNGDIYIRPVDSTPNGNLLIGNVFDDKTENIFDTFKNNYPILYNNYVKKIENDGTIKRQP